MGDYASRERENDRCEARHANKPPIQITQEPAPAIKTEKVSEVVFTNRQLLELVRTHYGADVVPAHAEVRGHYPNGSPLEGLVFRWSTPVSE